MEPKMGIVPPDDGQYPQEEIAQESGYWTNKPIPAFTTGPKTYGTTKNFVTPPWPRPDGPSYYRGNISSNFDIDMLAAATSDEHRQAADMAISNENYISILRSLVLARITQIIYDAFRNEIPVSALRGVLVQ